MKQLDPKTILEAFVNARPTKIEAAQELGISAAFLHDILKGNRGIPAKVLDALGLKQIVVKS